MFLTNLEIKYLLSLYSEHLLKAKIEEIFETVEGYLVFRLYKPQGKYYLNFVSTPVHSLFFLSEALISPKNLNPSAFTLFVRSRLKNGALLESSQYMADGNIERLIYFKMSSSQGLFYLYHNLISKEKNFYLCNAENIVLNRLEKTYGFKQGEVFRFPETVPSGIFKNRFEGKNLKASETLILQALKEDRITYYRTVYSKKLKKLEETLKKVREDFRNCSKWETFKEEGELLKSNLYLLKKGLKEVKLINYFKENCPEITIVLDPSKNPVENIEEKFSKYRKLKRGINFVEERKAKLEKEETSLKALLLDLEAGVLEKTTPEKAKNEKINEKKEGQTAKPYHHLILEGSYKLFIGKSSEGNQEVTFKIGSGNDLWFHILGFEGSHVLLKADRKGEIPQHIIKAAAILALHFSKRRKDMEGEVVKTYRKYVSPLKGALPGTVRYTQETVLKVKYNEAELQRILK